MAQWIEQFIRNTGYFGLALISFLENIFPPIPSEVIMPLGGYLVAQGTLVLWGVVLAGTTGSFLGALALYYLGRRFKREQVENWADRHGHWLLLTRGDVESAFDWFDRHGGAAVFICRLVPGVRSLISIPAGVSGMGFGKFFAYSVVGTAIWTTLLTLVGMWLGQQYQDADSFLKWLNYLVIGMIVLTVVGWVIKKRKEQRRQGQSDEDAASLHNSTSTQTG